MSQLTIQHIVLVISQLTCGGAEKNCALLANHLAQQGIQVSVLTYQDASGKVGYDLDASITVKALDLQAKSSSSGKLLGFLKRVFRLRRELVRLNPDRIISFMDRTNVEVAAASLGLKKSVIISERIHPQHHPIPRFYALLRKFLYPFCQLLVVQSQAVADFFSGYRLPISIIPNALSVPEGQSTLSETCIMSAGRLESQKGHDILIRAFSKIAQQYPEWRLVIYGEGSLRASLTQLISQLGLEERISLPGRTAHLHQAMCEASIFVLASRFEGMPNVLLEAMSLGLPVISSHFSGVDEIVTPQKNGLIFPVDSVEALASDLENLIAHPEQRSLLGAAAKESIKQYDPVLVFSKWDEAINECINRN